MKSQPKHEISRPEKSELDHIVPYADLRQTVFFQGHISNRDMTALKLVSRSYYHLVTDNNNALL